MKYISEIPRPREGADYYMIHWNDGEGTNSTLHFWKDDSRADAIVALFDFDIRGYVSDLTTCREDDAVRATHIYLRKEKAGEDIL